MNNNKAEYEAIIERLRNGEIEQFLVKKENFLDFREVLMAQNDKEQICGEAKKGGDVVYTYINESMHI